MSHSVSVTSSGASVQAVCSSCGFKGFVRSNPAAAKADANKHVKKAN